MARFVLASWSNAGVLARTKEDLFNSSNHIFLRDCEFKILCNSLDIKLEQDEQIKIDIRKVPVKK